jgi:hypothetical protein
MQMTLTSSITSYASRLKWHRSPHGLANVPLEELSTFDARVRDTHITNTDLFSHWVRD